MVEANPIHQIEHTLAAELFHAHRRVLGVSPSEVQVHLREQTIVCLVECREMPVLTPDQVEALDVAIDELVARVLGRDVERPISRARLSERSALKIMRLV